MRIAINGFGRIGKSFFRVLLANPEAWRHIDVVAINVGPNDPSLIPYAIKYDTIMGTLDEDIQYKDGLLSVKGKQITVCAERDPGDAPWKDLAVDWVVDCSGTCTERERAERHCIGGAGHVLISAPACDEDITIIPGVNDEKLDTSKHIIVSLGSCTTNALLPVIKVLHESFELTSGYMTTIHSYTNTQKLLDVDPKAKDPRRSRAAALNIIPTTTGAAALVGKIMPELEGKVTARAVRVPVAAVSLIDFTFTGQRDFDASLINEVLGKTSARQTQRIIALSDEPLVSSDYVLNPYSVTIATDLTSTVGGLGKVFGWYDNEWGYSCRLKDFLMKCVQEGC